MGCVMHDPMTVAFEIKYPWWRKNSLGGGRYHDSFITVWHVDPERDGSDDSCGWSSPKLTKAEKEKIKGVVKFDQKYLFDEVGDGRHFEAKFDNITMCFNLFPAIAWRVWQKQIKPRHLPEIMSLSTNHMDSFSFHRPMDQYDIDRTAIFIGRAFKRMERKWWQHPRFHFWHWKIQIRPLQALRRWIFDRCAICKGRFKYGESVMGSWSGESIWHHRCDHVNQVKK